MVLQKRLDYGSSGYQVPVMPHVPRSAKGKRSARKKADDNQMCPIDLLATVAETLLEREISATPFSSTGISCAKIGSVKQEQFYKEKPLKAETFLDRRSCFNEISVGSDILFQSEEERSLTPNTGSVLINSDASDKDASGKSIISGTWGGRGYSLGTIPEKRSIERHSPGSMESHGCKAEDGIKKPLHQGERRTSGDTIDGNHSGGMCRLDDPMDLDSKPPALASSDSSVEVPLCGGPIAHNTSFPKFRDGMERAADRDDDDDDENSSGCTHPRTITSKAFRPQRIGDRRIKKLMASKFWKVGPTTFKDEEISDTEMKPFSRSRKMCYTRQRTQRCSFKRRKLFEHRTVSASRGGMCDEGTSNSPVKGSIKVEPSDSHENLHEANRAFSSTGCQNSSYESGDFHVKFSIKSFKVPELFIEMPKTATVASLKRTVMEAVTAILGGGLRVGVVLQGKKVRDDNKTLLQAGISHGDELENLGFTLEPSATQAPPPLTTPDDPHFLLLCDATEPLSRIPAVAPPSDQGAFSATLPPPLTTVVNYSESDHDSVHSSIDASSLAANSKALVPVPAMSVDALAVVPLRKSRRSELVQRRIRRPFSVSEVEALVQAVEKLGTGRWRDVKLRAFDNAKHRTYVDLKDKWKTLVHTARISPQQRRGEPVPQELLDRVLAAHAHWSQHQAKLQVKPPPSAGPACLLI